MNLRAILAGGRIPEYHQHADELTPAQYIDKVSRKEIYDPILSFQQANDFQVKRLLRKYLPEDEQSRGYATLLEWNNILFEPAASVLDNKPTQVRVGAVQCRCVSFPRWKPRFSRSNTLSMRSPTTRVTLPFSQSCLTRH